MLRTQVYLNKKQHRYLKRRAAEEDKSMSQKMRDWINEKAEQDQVGLSDAPLNSGEWLLSLAEKSERGGVRGPKDLASRADEYYYGEL